MFCIVFKRRNICNAFKFFLLDLFVMERNNLIGLILVLFIFVFAGIYFLYPEEKFTYSEKINGIIFNSNSFSSPQKYFSETIKERDSIIFISEIDSEQSNLVEVSTQIALVSGVLSATGKQVSSVIYVLNSNNELDYCQTNFGDKSKNEKLTKRQCESLLENSSDFKFIIKFPDEKLFNPSVEMYNNSLIIKPTKKEEGIIILQQVFTAMYSDSNEIINRINAILHSVTT